MSETKGTETVQGSVLVTMEIYCSYFNNNYSSCSVKYISVTFTSQDISPRTPVLFSTSALHVFSLLDLVLTSDRES